MAREGAPLLADLTVVEIGDDVAVRFCGHLFAALGARVLRASASGDKGIGYAGHCGEAYGAWLDAGKTVGPVDPGQSCDLVIGGLARESLKSAEGHAHASGAPFLAMSWFAATGPYSRWQANDEVIAALNGTAYVFGERDGPPMLVQGHSAQLTTAAVAFNAALAVMMQAPSARPQRIDVNVFEAALCYCEAGALTGLLPDGAAVRLGINRFNPTYPGAPYRTSDGWIGLTCLTPAQWTAMCRLIGRPELAEDLRFATAADRLAHSDAVDAALTPAILIRTTDEWVELGVAHRIPITPMPRPGELPDTPHWVGRGAFAEFGLGSVQGPVLPYKISTTGQAYSRARTQGPDGPLAGLRVIDFSMGWAGPLAARTLADLGADVIKVECDSHPDWWRGWEAGSVDRDERETKHNFIDMNRNKRGVDLDLATPSGLAKAKVLVADADVVIENYAAGVLEKLGLGPSEQRRLSPGVVSLSMPAFGNSGPLSGVRAYGSTVEQASGLPFVNGEGDWAPAQQHVAFGDPISGLFAAGAVLACLHARSKLGGATIDLAQVACLFQLAADAIVAEQVLGSTVPRTGHSRARLPFCAIVPCQGEDRWLLAAPNDEDQFETMAAIVGGLNTHALKAWAAKRTAEDGAELLQSAGVCAAPVTPPHELTYDPQLATSEFWLAQKREFVGPHLVAASPFRFDGARPKLRRPAPVLGEHTAEVFADLSAEATS